MLKPKGFSLSALIRSAAVATGVFLVASSALAQKPRTVMAEGPGYDFPTNLRVRWMARGDNHSLFLTRDGAVLGYGDNGEGQLNIPSFGQPVTMITTSIWGSGALLADGSLRIWGRAPSNVPDGQYSHFAIASNAGYGVRTDGVVVAWGPSAILPSEPVTNARRIYVSKGGDTVIAHLTDGTYRWWGMEMAEAPPESTVFKQISLGYGHAVGLRSDGQVVAWGGWEGEGNAPEVPADRQVESVVATNFGIALLLDDGQVIATSFGSPTSIEVPSLRFESITGGRGVIGIIRRPSATLTLSAATAIGGGAAVEGTVTIPEPATEDLTVFLASDKAEVTVPTSVTIPQGQSSVTFEIEAATVPSALTATITADGDVRTSRARIRVWNLVVKELTLASTTLLAGQSFLGTVKLTSMAAQDTVVALSSTGGASVPATVTVLAGSDTATFTVGAAANADSAKATVSATYGGVRTVRLNVLGIPTVRSMKMGLPYSGASSVVAIAFATAFPVDRQVTISTSGGVGAPSSVTVPAGSKSIPVAITVPNTPGATIGVTCESRPGVTTSVSSTVIANSVGSFTLDSYTVAPATTVQVTGSVSLKATPSVATTVSISAPGLPGTIPSSVVVPANATVITFPIDVNSVTKRKVVTITLTVNGVSIKRNLTINPAP